MDRTILLKSGISTSRLAFGCSRLHHVATRARANIIAAAIDLGFGHFDAAPSYGDGVAEHALGRFLGAQRQRVVIATKYGIPAARRPWGPALRGIRSLAQRIDPWKRQMPEIESTGLRTSLELSLKRLRTEWVDVLLLHEPSLERVRDPAAVLGEMIELRRRGLIRAFGLAGNWARMSPLLSTMPDFGLVIQTAEDQWPAHSPPDITYGAIAVGPQRFRQPTTSNEVACERVRWALARRENGAVLVSTTRPEHLRDLVAAAMGVRP